MEQFWMIFLLGFLGLVVWAMLGGLTWLMFLTFFPDSADVSDNPLPIFASILWPVGLPIVVGLGVTLLTTRSCCGWWRKRKRLQAELDEARRKKDEQDAADALKEGYR